MKKILLLIFSVFILISADAQKKPGTYWTAIGGVKGGFNNPNIRFGSNVPAGSISSSWVHYGVAAGAWAAFPLTKSISLQPELLYSQMGGSAIFPVDPPKWYDFYDLKTDYITIPVLLKLHYKNIFAVYAGPQFGFLTKANASIFRGWTRTDIDYKDSISKTDIAFAGGIQLFPRCIVHADVRYIYGLTNIWKNKTGNYFNNGLQFTLGLRLFGKKYTVKEPDRDGDGIIDKEDKCPDTPGIKEYDGCPIPDTDGDGINDKEDKCPTVKGVREYEGCPIPDTDGDGINDKEDKCPSVPGVKEYQGCPIPDTDGDGILDINDKCPTVPGVIEYQGCPIPDTDGDGLNDKEDKCPNLAGPRENQGCPVIPLEIIKKVDYAARYILFATAKYKLLSKSFKGLEEVVKILKDNPDMYLSIDGHTDNVGKDEYNHTLSHNRAGAVKDYFISKGIAETRLRSAGHGESMPIADNKTTAGRQKNRRVEMKLSYYW